MSTTDSQQHLVPSAGALDLQTPQQHKVDVHDLAPESHLTRSYKTEVTVLPDEHIRTHQREPLGCIITERHIIIPRDCKLGTGSSVQEKQGAAAERPKLSKEQNQAGREPPRTTHHTYVAPRQPPPSHHAQRRPEAKDYVTEQDALNQKQVLPPPTDNLPPSVSDHKLTVSGQPLQGGIFRGDVEIPQIQVKVVPKYVEVPIRTQKVVQRKKPIKKYVKRPILVPVEEVVYQDVPKVERRVVYQDLPVWIGQQPSQAFRKGWCG
eukprot:Protomagalhaensia_wolfi_Nauph_80__2610@NODE_2756_length_997_cov_9_693111_g2161_i0_p1_GENE_NODE_2756_length_997_cov_9_693111_g2161_i0NODE_2756_length_997_cov_9_693111_g2161_i0_p1_ORF_typecomplete_len264_score37_99IMCp/PF12314_8/2_7_NODE_2756_length_997_cov_9_693111_g2161_i034825